MTKEDEELQQLQKRMEEATNAGHIGTALKLAEEIRKHLLKRELEAKSRGF